MNRQRQIRVCEYTLTPGPRHVSDGAYSGEEFRNNVLRPEFDRAVSNGTSVTVILDGTRGYASSFLEEAFGGLVREMNDVALVRQTISVVSKTRPWYEKEIAQYIEEALR